MSRSPDRAPEPLVVRSDEGDAWGEFLSESSTELQHLRAELHRQPSALPSSGSAPPPPTAAAPRQAVRRLALPPGRDLARPSPVADLDGDFAQESAAAASARPAARTRPVLPTTGAEAQREGGDDREGLTLAALLGHGVPVLWPEAVATIEELCRAVVRRAGSAPAPTLEQIVITPSGEVHLLGTAGRCDTAALGVLLQTLLVDTETPLPLRLFVTSSATSSRYGSIEDYADALSHYSPSNRTELVAALCRRGFRNAAAAGTAVGVVPRASASVEAGAPSERAHRQWWLWIAAALAISLAAGAGAWIGYVAAWSAAAASQHPPSPRVVSSFPPERAQERAIPAGTDLWAPGTIMPFESRPGGAPRTSAGESVRAADGPAPPERTGLNAPPSAVLDEPPQ